MPHIDPKDQVLTLINTFTVAPENHDELVNILDDATRNAMSKMPGFISASLHTSPGKTRVANYAQWCSEADLHAAIAHPDFRPHFEACQRIAKADPQIYRVHTTEEAMTS